VISIFRQKLKAELNLGSCRKKMGQSAWVRVLKIWVRLYTVVTALHKAGLAVLMPELLRFA